MDAKTMKEKLKEAKDIYFMDDFRAYMRKLHSLTDADFKKHVPGIKEHILKSPEKDPVTLFEKIFDDLMKKWEAPSPLPVSADWHHFIVPGVVMAALRNNGYSITDQEINEAMSRGERLAGGSCGFMGTCGGAYSVGIIASMVKKVTPLHDAERSEVMRLVSETLTEISRYERRCCKRSSYLSIQKAVKFLQGFGFEKIPYSEIDCRWSPQNKMCLGKKCLYFPKSKEVKKWES